MIKKALLFLSVFLFVFYLTGCQKQDNTPVFDAIVDGSGGSDYVTVQAAIDAAPENNASPWLIFIKNGSYMEVVLIPENKPFIHLIGQDKDKTIIHEKLHVGRLPPPESPYYKSDSAAWEFSVNNRESTKYRKQGTVVMVNGSDFYAENISFVNDWGVESKSGPQALAMRTTNDRMAFYNCIFRSFQDTWQTSPHDEHRLYASHCWIEGAVDYFYGSGEALVENSTFYNVRSASVIVAPRQKTAKHGYVFRNCIVDGVSAAADGNQKLGRPWHDSPKTVYIHTTMRIPIHPEGWMDMGSVPALFAEYDSRDTNGNLIDLSLRKTFYDGRDGVKGTCRTTISKEEADLLIYENIIPGADNWDPRRLMIKLPAPEKVKLTGRKLSWKPVNGAIGYIVFNGDEIVGMTKSSTLHIGDSNGTRFQVCAVSESGALGEKT